MLERNPDSVFRESSSTVLRTHLCGAMSVFMTLPVPVSSWSLPLMLRTSRRFHGILQGGASKGEGYLKHLREPRGALGNTREYWGVLSYLPPLDPPTHALTDPPEPLLP